MAIVTTDKPVKLDYEWRELGPSADIGGVKLREGGRYIVCGVEKTVIPNKLSDVHSPGQGFMMFAYDGSRWFGCRIRVGPEWQVTEGAFEGYLVTVNLQDIEASEVFKTPAEENQEGPNEAFVRGGLYVGGGIALYLLFGWIIVPSILGIAGFGGILDGLGVGGKKKFVRLTTENGVFEIKASRFHKMLINRLWEQQIEKDMLQRLDDSHAEADAAMTTIEECRMAV